ncbi:TPA: hypothetical protein ACH3X1_013571 [Trebouxia sp. C0004]
MSLVPWQHAQRASSCHWLSTSSPPGKDVQKIDLHNLTRSKRKFVVAQALESEDADASLFFANSKTVLRGVEVRFQNLSVNAEVAVGARGEPTVLNAYRNKFENLLQQVGLMKPSKTQFCILDDFIGTLRPGCITLLLGPPGAGKSTLLNALAGRLQKTVMHVTGDITYNGKGFDQFRAVHTASYIDQNDLHQPLLTVKETLDFAARVQGVGHKEKKVCDVLLLTSCCNLVEELKELHAKEKDLNIEPDLEVEMFTKASALSGKHESITTDLVIKLLGLDVCEDTLIGSDQVRGVSGGQRKRVTTGELLVGPKKTLFLDEISTGLDSSTTFQITRTLRDFSHLRQATMLIALLQPTPETYNLFDDILLMSEGKMVYHGPREHILPFFESQGMHCPPRKADSDFLQEVTSRRDQQQYWNTDKGEYKYVPVTAFADAFQQTATAQRNMQYLDEPYVAPNPKCDEALITHKYALSALGRMKALMQREFLLMKRNLVVYKAKVLQVVFMALVTATLFLRTHIHPISPNDGQEVAGFLFFATLTMLFNGLANLSMTVADLPVFWKQQHMLFYDAVSFSFPAFLQRIPFSMAASLVWTVITYFPVGLAGSPAAYGSDAVHMVTEEALAERKAALEGDPGTESAVKVDMPQEPFMRQAQLAKQPAEALQTMLTCPRRTLGAEQSPGTIPPPLESPLLHRLNPVTVQQARPDVGRSDSAEEQDNKSPGSKHGSQETLAKALGQDAKETNAGRAGKDSGMVLPFDPMTMTFKDLHYFVPIPKVNMQLSGCCRESL